MLQRVQIHDTRVYHTAGRLEGENKLRGGDAVVLDVEVDTGRARPERVRLTVVDRELKSLTGLLVSYRRGIKVVPIGVGRIEFQLKQGVFALGLDDGCCMDIAPGRILIVENQRPAR